MPTADPFNLLSDLSVDHGMDLSHRCIGTMNQPVCVIYLFDSVSGYFHCVGNLVTDCVDATWQILCCSYFRWLALAHLCCYLHNQDWIFDTQYREDLCFWYIGKMEGIRRCSCSWSASLARRSWRPYTAPQCLGMSTMSSRPVVPTAPRQQCSEPNASNDPLDQ